MEKLFFCRDGVLRTGFMRYDKSTHTRHDHMVPMLAYEKVVDKHAFLKSLHSPIAFEHGLTVGELMENLAPWAETMIGAGVLDFPAFLEEVRRTPSEIVDDIENIVLYYRASLTAVPQFGKTAENELFGPPEVSGKVTLQQRWDMQARLTEAGRKAYGGATEVAIDYTPMSSWKHLEIKFELQGEFRDETACWLDQKYIGVKKPFTDASHPMIGDLKNSHGGVSAHTFPITAPCPDFFNCLIRGFFWEVGFSYSPQQRDEQLEEMQARKSELDDCLESSPCVEEALKDLETATEEDDNLEFQVKTTWLEDIEAACKAQGLPLPKKI